MVNSKWILYCSLLLCLCSTPMRNYLEEPPKMPPPADTSAARPGDTLSLEVKKNSSHPVVLRLEPLR